MSETIDTSGSAENRKVSDSTSHKLPIRDEESEAFGERLKLVIGSESLRSFAKRCSMSDGLLGAYIRGEKSPGLDRLVAIADAGSVMIDWLATGRPPKTRAEWRARVSPTPTSEGAFDGRRDMLEAVLRVAEHKIRNNQVDRHVIDAAIVGAPSWLDAARDYPDLEARLRTLVATIEFMKAAGIR